MKKGIALFLALVMLLSMCGCGDGAAEKAAEEKAENIEKARNFVEKSSGLPEYYIVMTEYNEDDDVFGIFVALDEDRIRAGIREEVLKSGSGINTDLLIDSTVIYTINRMESAETIETVMSAVLGEARVFIKEDSGTDVVGCYVKTDGGVVRYK